MTQLGLISRRQIELDRFSKDRATKKETVLARLREFFERFRDLI